MPLYSLKNQKQFNLVNKRGKKISTRYFIIIFVKKFKLPKINDSEAIFFGMKVSKKLSKKAVVRNKIKRRIRHLMQLMTKDKNLDMNQTALIFIPYKNFEKITFSRLSYDLQKTLKLATDTKLCNNE